MTDNNQTDYVQRIYDVMKLSSHDEDCVQLYRKWSSNGRYDEDVSSANHNGSVMAADQLEKFYSDNLENVSILDVAAGTGRASAELRQRGFVKIDALDISQDMLDIARSKNLYSNYYCSSIGETQVDIPDGTYDALCCVGGISPGHIPGTAVIEMLRLVKPGGIVTIVGSEAEWNRLPEYSVKMEGFIKDLEDKGKLRVIHRETKEGYLFGGTPHNIDGIIITLRKA